MISVDGDTSTNDTALLLANGMAGNEEDHRRNTGIKTFKEALHYINETLAKKWQETEKEQLLYLK